MMCESATRYGTLRLSGGYATAYATMSIAAKGAPARRPPPPHPRSRPAGKAGHPYDLARAPRRRRSRRRPHRLALQLSTSTRPHYADAPGPAARGQPCWPPSPSSSPDARAAAPAPQAGCPAGHATTASCCCPVSNHQGGNVGIAEGVATGMATGMAGLCGVLSVQLVGRSPSTRPPSSATADCACLTHASLGGCTPCCRLRVRGGSTGLRVKGGSTGRACSCQSISICS